jgi:hypothetical protein
LLHEAHCGHTGHPGIKATVKILKDNAAQWRGMTAHVAQFISQCPTCNLTRISHNPALTSASTIRKDAFPLRRWHIDQTGTLTPCAFTGFTRFILFIDECTGFIQLFGSKFGTSLEVVAAFIQVIGLFGLPHSFHSDNGPENDTHLWKQICEITGIKHTVSLPFQPHTNGMSERAIQTSKRFLLALCVDLQKHNSWGLLLSIACRAVNSLPRDSLGCSPNQLVFAAFNDSSSFVIPGAPTRPVNASQHADANVYSIGGNFAHRAMHFQQTVTYAYAAEIQKRFDKSASKNPLPIDMLNANDMVLVDWPDNSPPSPLHPKLRGPYRIVSIHNNIAILSHCSDFPMQDQPKSLRWSLHARIYKMDDDVSMQRVRMDPSASMVAASTPSLAIDCILSHSVIVSLRDRNRSNDPSNSRFFAKNQIYTVRYWGNGPRYSRLSNSLPYDELLHTLALDSYLINTPILTGHVPTLHAPMNWNPKAPAESARPAHAPLVQDESQLPFIDAPLPLHLNLHQPG